ncbi:MAG TPA: GNAT family N-acetyltransferase [Rhizomicrobium sp.]|jgi:ribosomal protein S18 acetylase RimI-like enzyme|nr:GNAT family N-acetyltransferase [Rhizomicrobium sp.]
MESIVRAGETYSLPRDMSRDQALEHWFAPDRSVFVAEEGGLVLGTYYLRANRPGPGAHVSNAGFMVSDKAGGRGVGQALCEHALATAKARGFAAMQFNFVVAANERAVRLWQRVGFAEIGRAPDAFQHPRLGLVDALVMHRKI